jgi:hypothetical protein
VWLIFKVIFQTHKSKFQSVLNFEKWRNREIDSFKLNDLIHQHHQGPSRELWKFYTYADPDTAVARAVKFDLLKKEEIPDDLLESIAPRLDLFNNNDES